MSANSDCDPNANPPKKKARIRNCTFNSEWLKNPDFNKWLARDIDEKSARCLYYKTLISVKYDGISAVKKHAEGANHKRLIKADKVSNTITTFFPKVDSNLQLEVTAVEVSKTFHNVMHGLSYASADCGKYCFL